MSNCWSCKGTGRDYDAADHSTSDCDVCRGTGRLLEKKKPCHRCVGDGVEYDGIERGITTCSSCSGTGELPEPVRTSLDDRARDVAQRVIDEMCKAKQRPRDVVERALVAFALSERKNS